MIRFLLLFIITSTSHAKSILDARIFVDLALPGIFSVQLCKELKSLKENGVPIRALLDSTYLNHPQNLIGKLRQSVSDLRILEESSLIPHQMILLDGTHVLYGGNQESHFSTKSAFPALLIDQKSPDFSKISKRFEELWSGSNPETSARLLKGHQVELGKVTRSVKMEPQTVQQIQPFVGSKSGKVYYRSTSKAALRIKPENRVYFLSEEDAQAKGRKRSKRFE